MRSLFELCVLPITTNNSLSWKCRFLLKEKKSNNPEAAKTFALQVKKAQSSLAGMARWMDGWMDG